MRVYCSLGIEGGVLAAKKVHGHKLRLVHRSFSITRKQHGTLYEQLQEMRQVL